MLEKSKRERIIALVNKEVVPAIGCTEPMAVALCTAKAATTLGKRPERIEVLLSPNMLKNAMGVGIPGTGMIGLPIAVSLGALIGKPEYQLEVLKDLTPDSLEQGKQYIKDADINIKLKQGDVDKLYIEIICHAGEDQATAIISGSHTHFVYVERNGEVVLDKRGGTVGDEADDDIQLNFPMVYEFATTAPLDEISFILKTRDYNMKAAELSIKGNYGHCLGKTMDRPLSHGIFGDNIFSHIISRTASACDARTSFTRCINWTTRSGSTWFWNFPSTLKAVPTHTPSAVSIFWATFWAVQPVLQNTGTCPATAFTCCIRPSSVSFPALPPETHSPSGKQWNMTDFVIF